MDDIGQIRHEIDKKAFSVQQGFDGSDLRAYWHSKTPYECLISTEINRRITYDYDPSTTRLQRVLKITQRA